jgi:hypothetical protein
MLTYAAREYLITCKNHVALNIVARIARAFKRFYDACA